jgi:uncharacterized protein (DUF2235 family)
MSASSYKRIIVCSDGTWNRPGIKDGDKDVETNVQIIYKCIAKSDHDGVRQVKAYDSGVGSSTYSWKDKIFGGIAGDGIDKKIKDLYTFILMNYEKGDQIYLFGFSRGAYTVRSLAGFIRNCGILTKHNLPLIDRAYELYRDRNEFTLPDSDLMLSFKNDYCVEEMTRIRLLGVWDTVGSLGIPLPWYRFYNRERYKFHDVKLSNTIDYAYHALAIDEREDYSDPTLWERSDRFINGEQTTQVMEQRWFAGVHCNIGGGYADRKLSDLSLQWMMEKAQGAGLYFDQECEEYKAIGGSEDGLMRNSSTLLYSLLWRPIFRDILNARDSDESIDDSVVKRYKNEHLKYRPHNLRGKID